MKCPICGNIAQEGGLIADSIYIGWIPQEELQKKPVKEVLRFSYPGLQTISKQVPFLKKSKVPSAYFCKHCNKVFGIFDVTDDYT